MHDQWYFTSEKIVEGFYRIEIVHSGQFLTATPERSTLVQQDENPNKHNEYQIFHIEHVGYRDYVIRHNFSGLILSVQNASPSPCAPIVLYRLIGSPVASQRVNFERVNDESNDFYIFLKHTRMLMDIDGASLQSNARLVQYPQKRHQQNHPSQRFRLHRIFLNRNKDLLIENFPREFLR